MNEVGLGGLFVTLGRAWCATAMADAANPGRARCRRLRSVECDLQECAGDLCWTDAADALIDLMESLDTEVAIAVVDDKKAGDVRVEEVGTGASEHVNVDVDQIVALATAAGPGSKIVLLHNHPDAHDGPSPWFSAEDLRSRQALRDLLRPIGCELEEVVISGNTARLVKCCRAAARFARRNRR